MRAKTTIWTRRLVVAAAAGATVVLLGAGVSNAASARGAHKATVADATWGAPALPCMQEPRGSLLTTQRGGNGSPRSQRCSGGQG